MIEQLLSVQKTLLKVTAPLPIVLAANVFGTGTFHWQLVSQNMYTRVNKNPSA